VALPLISQLKAKNTQNKANIDKYKDFYKNYEYREDLHNFISALNT